MPTGPLGVWLSKKFGTTNILSLHGGDIYDPSKMFSPHRWWCLRKCVEYALNNSNFVCCQSNNTKSNTLRYYNCRKDVSIIPLPYEKKKFKTITRRELELDDDKKYLISVGRLVKRKGFEYLIEALSRISDEKVEAIIVSDGPELNRLKQLSEHLKVRKRVHFVGMVPEERKFQLLAAADVYVLSSIHEGFGIVLQEAMQVGLPIVATNNGGQLDLIRHEINGYLVETENAEALKNAITKVLNDTEVSKRFIKFNKQTLEQYSPLKIAEKYMEMGL